MAKTARTDSKGNSARSAAGSAWDSFVIRLPQLSALLQRDYQRNAAPALSLTSHRYADGTHGPFKSRLSIWDGHGFVVWFAEGPSILEALVNLDKAVRTKDPAADKFRKVTPLPEEDAPATLSGLTVLDEALGLAGHTMGRAPLPGFEHLAGEGVDEV